MRIDEFINKALQKSVLKKVRIRVDPKESCSDQYHLSTSYEGYVLEESETSIKIYFIDTPKGIEPIQQVDKKHIIEPADTKKNNFIQELINILIGTGIEENHPVLQQISNLKDLEFLETYLKELGLDDRAISKLYKKMCLVRAEGIISTLNSPGFVGAAKAGGSIVNAIADAPTLLVGKNTIFKRMANFLRSFDVRDILQFVKEVPLTAGNMPDPKKNSYILINGIGGDTYLDETKYSFNLKGQFTGQTLSTEDASFNFIITGPKDREINFSSGSLDYKRYNPHKTGVLCLNRKHKTEVITSCYRAKVTKSDNIMYVEAVTKIEGPKPKSERLEELKNLDALIAQGFKPAVDFSKLNEENKIYLLNLANHLLQHKEVQDKVDTIVTKVLESTEYKRLADENKKADLLRYKLNIAGIKPTLTT